MAPVTALADRRPPQALPHRNGGPQGRRPRDRGGRVLRAPRPQRRRQVDADPLHDRASPSRPGGEIQVFGHDAVHHYREARMAVGLAPQELNLDWFLTAAESLDYHGGYFGMSRRERRERTAELLDTFSLTREEGRADADAVGRHEAAPDPGPRADAPAAAADPRRADRRRRRRAAARAVALRPEDQRRGHHDPAHDALPRRGRAALQQGRVHQRRPDRRDRARARSWPSSSACRRWRTRTSSSSGARSSRAPTSSSEAA